MRNLLIIAAVILVMGCQKENPPVAVDTTEFQIYQRVTSAESGLNFVNQLTETKYMNSTIYDAMVQGAGIGLLDVNNDGLEDIFFAGNQVADRLFLNKGNLQFEDITSGAGIQNSNDWSNGVAIADVNGDGWDDIYVCKFLFDEPEKRINLYYENQRDGTFRERGAELGIDDDGYSVMATFLDYDLDGDLDLYIANQPPNSIYIKPKINTTINYIYTDRLYRNDKGRFTDVTKEAGILNYSYSLSVVASDVNKDGYVDIYVACDYEEPDFLWINKGDGTFVNRAIEMLRHISNFSMGSDIADINNDGWPDIFTADMVARDHFRNKVNMGGMNPEKFWQLVNAGYHYQYMFNSLQLNNGNGTFSEIAQLAGVSHTDWSWAGLFMDMNHDGRRDLFVTNGQLKEMGNRDWRIFRSEVIEARDPETDLHEMLYELVQKAPQQKLSNFAFINQGNLKFESIASEWGLAAPTWSQGAVYGDLDNDGDLEILVSNSNEEVHLYKSYINESQIHHYLVIQIDGYDKNTRGLNAKAVIHYGDESQYAELTPVRGYMSSVQDRFHFGLGGYETVDEVEIQWQDGKVWKGENIKANQILSVSYADAQSTAPRDTRSQQSVYFNNVYPADSYIFHVENEFDDYAREVLIPYKMSTLGPVVASADINQDNLEDFYLGGSVDQSGQLFVQTAAGRLEKLATPVFDNDARYEDGAAVFVDFDKDGDQDLFVASGGNEYPAGSDRYVDRLYVNDGTGQFRSRYDLPRVMESTGVVAAMDYDSDGDVDFFLGSRQVPGHYGFVPRSTILSNDNGVFADVGETILPALGKWGMVTDGQWVDMNGDGVHELVVVGEWMRVSVYSWNGKVMEEVDIPSLENTNGLWNRVVAADVDGDGDNDLIAGNLGMNNKYRASHAEPFKLFVNDFDLNGTHDIYLGTYDHGEIYPVRGRDCSSEQMPFVQTKYTSYTTFAQATIDEILKDRMEGTIEQRAEVFESGIFYNQGDFQFEFVQFDNQAQVAPIYGILVTDFNQDGYADLLLAGNYYNREIETTRSDAGIGCLLLGSETGEFEYVHPSQTGLLAYGDVRDILYLEGPRPYIGIVNNHAQIQFYQFSNQGLQGIGAR